MDNRIPRYDGDFGLRLQKKEQQREIKHSAVLALILIFTSYLAAAIAQAAFTALILALPRVSLTLISVFDTVSYTVQLAAPLAVYFLLSKKSYYDIYNPEKDVPKKEKITPFSIFRYFTLAFALSHIMAIISSLFSEKISMLVSHFSENLVLDEQAFALPAPNSDAEFAITIISTALLPAILEELLFRGAVLSEFLKYGRTFAIVTSAFFFASVHGSIEQMMFSFVYGVLFGFIAVRTGSLTTGIIIHFLNNAYTCTLEYLEGIYGGYIFSNILVLLNFTLILAGLAYAVYAIARNRFDYSENIGEDTILTGKETYSVFLSLPMILYYIYVAAETLYVYIAYNIMT